MVPQSILVGCVYGLCLSMPLLALKFLLGKRMPLVLLLILAFFAGVLGGIVANQ